MRPFEPLQAVLLVDKLLAFALARAFHAAVQNELHHLMQLSAIEKRAMAAADIHDGARQPAEIDSVHELAAPRTRPVVDGLGRRARRARPRW